jgi:hypothetical protein
MRPPGTGDLNQTEPGDEPVEEPQDEPLRSQKVMTHEEWDSGKINPVSQGGNAELTGKLCWCVMALICWQVGANKAVIKNMVRVLEEWLHR